MVEGSGFENRRTERYQGFESLLLRCAKSAYDEKRRDQTRLHPTSCGAAHSTRYQQSASAVAGYRPPAANLKSAASGDATSQLQYPFIRNVSRRAAQDGSSMNPAWKSQIDLSGLPASSFMGSIGQQAFSVWQLAPASLGPASFETPSSPPAPAPPPPLPAAPPVPRPPLPAVVEGEPAPPP